MKEHQSPSWSDSAPHYPAAHGQYPGQYPAAGPPQDLPNLPPPPVEIPGLGHPLRRLVARMIDWVIWACGAAALLIPLGVLTARDDGTLPPVTIVLFFVILIGGIWAAEALQLAFLGGRTVGKRAMGLRVAPRHDIDAPLTTGLGMGRGTVYPLLFLIVNALPLISILGLLNILWHLWDRPFRQCLHDKAAGTVVVDARVRPGRAV